MMKNLVIREIIKNKKIKKNIKLMKILCKIIKVVLL